MKSCRQRIECHLPCVVVVVVVLSRGFDRFRWAGEGISPKLHLGEETPSGRGGRYDPRSLSSDRILDRLPFLWVRREGNHPCLHLLIGGSRNRADPIVEGRPTQGTWDRPSILRCVLTPWPPCPTTRWGRPGPPEDTIRRTTDA